MELTTELLDASRWTDGLPPERALIAFFARATPDELAAILRRLLDGALAEFDSAPAPKFLRNRQALLPGAVIESRRDDDWDFPGGDWLEEALIAMETSAQMKRVPLRTAGLSGSNCRN